MKRLALNTVASPGAAALAVLVVLHAALFSGCGRTAQSASLEERPLVHVTQPITRDVTEYAYFTGRTDAVESVEIRARVTGYLVSVDFESGSDVKLGQRLFQIDPRPYQAELDELNAGQRVAEVKLQHAEADYERWVRLGENPGAASQQDLDNYTARRDQARAELAAAQAAARKAALKLEFTNVTSPIDGVVGRNLLTVGNLVQQDNTLLTTVLSDDPVFAYFDIDENSLLRIEKLMREGRLAQADGKRVRVELGLGSEDDDYPHVGELDFVNNRIFDTTATLQVRAVFPNPRPAAHLPRLLPPGLFVRLRMPLGSARPALLLPEVAICTDQGDHFVLSVNDRDVVEYRPITLGPREPGGWLVVEPVKVVRDRTGLRRARAGEAGTDSLTAGETIVASGLQRVRPGTLVRTQPYTLSPAAMAER